jgi:hypothetical protein
MPPGRPSDQFTNAYRGIQGAMADFLFNPFEKGVQGMLASFGKMLQRMIADAVAADLGKRCSAPRHTDEWRAGCRRRRRPARVRHGASNGTLGNLAMPGYRWIGAGAGGERFDSFAVGTDYVPRDMLAQIHQGETHHSRGAEHPARSGQPIHIT